MGAFSLSAGDAYLRDRNCIAGVVAKVILGFSWCVRHCHLCHAKGGGNNFLRIVGVERDLKRSLGPTLSNSNMRIFKRAIRYQMNYVSSYKTDLPFLERKKSGEG